MPAANNTEKLLAAVRKSPGQRVKVAVTDIDGILRGKYIHKDKFALGASKAASDSATSCTAGTCTTTATTTPA